MEIVVGIAIGVLVAVLIACTAACVFVLRRKFCQKKDVLSQLHAQNNTNIHLINNEEEAACGINIDDILNDDLLLDDMSGVVSHCLPILRVCHNLTTRLVSVTSVTLTSTLSAEESRLMEEMVRRISPRIDDILCSIDGSVDIRLLEARCTALVLSVTNMMLVVKSLCSQTDLIWAEDCLKELEGLLKVLRCESRRFLSSRPSSVTSETRSNAPTSSRGSHSQAESCDSGVDADGALCDSGNALCPSAIELSTRQSEAACYEPRIIGDHHAHSESNSV